MKGRGNDNSILVLFSGRVCYRLADLPANPDGSVGQTFKLSRVRGSEEQKAEHALTGVVLPVQAQDLRLRFRYPKVPEALRQTYA